MIEFLFIVLGVAYVGVGFGFARVFFEDMNRFSHRLTSLPSDQSDQSDSANRSYLIRKARESRRNLFLTPVWPVIIVLYFWGSLSDSAKKIESAEAVRDKMLREEIRAEIRNTELNMFKDFDYRLNGE